MRRARWDEGFVLGTRRWTRWSHVIGSPENPGRVSLPAIHCERCPDYLIEDDVAKRRMTLRMRIPPYRHPRNAWRELIHAEAVKVAESRGVLYRPEDRLELVITLYLDQDELRFHDVDNRLKDIMDALQGRAGGPKSRQHLIPVIPNDHQVFRVSIEKMHPPGQSRGMGHLVIKV